MHLNEQLIVIGYLCFFTRCAVLRSFLDTLFESKNRITPLTVNFIQVMLLDMGSQTLISRYTFNLEAISSINIIYN